MHGITDAVLRVLGGDVKYLGMALHKRVFNTTWVKA